MFALRKETDLAIQLLKRLAKSKKGYTSLQDVADETGISFLFLQKVARKLRLGKLIQSTYGINGGYKLAVPTSKINLKKVMEVMGDGCMLLPCSAAEAKVCQYANSYCVGPKLKKLNMQLNQVLAKVSLQKM